jgi:hypothetical protein
MSQFALYRNRNPASRSRFPVLLDIQSDLLEPGDLASDRDTIVAAVDFLLIHP